MEAHMIDTASQQLDGLPTRGAEDWTDNCDCLHPEAVFAARRALGNAPADEVARILAVLGDPTRIRVVLALAGAELCVTDLAVATGVNRTTISHQLRVLRDHRLVRRRREGKVVYYALDDDHVTALLNMVTAHVTEAHIEAGDRKTA
jgi:DNA-binding transcriptional ArsR family regulator